MYMCRAQEQPANSHKLVQGMYKLMIPTKFNNQPITHCLTKHDTSDLEAHDTLTLHMHWILDLAADKTGVDCNHFTGGMQNRDGPVLK